MPGVNLMKIYFLRHAEAEDGADDAARRLTEKGRDQSKAMGKFLAASGVVFDAAYTSPLVRAVQTAELALAATNKKEKIKLQVTDFLLNEAGDREFDAWLVSLKRAERILLVGHNPSMTCHVARLLGASSPTSVEMPKAAVACLSWEPPDAPALKLFLPVKALPK